MKTQLWYDYKGFWRGLRDEWNLLKSGWGIIHVRTDDGWHLYMDKIWCLLPIFFSSLIHPFGERG